MESAYQIICCSIKKIAVYYFELATALRCPLRLKSDLDRDVTFLETRS